MYQDTITIRFSDVDHALLRMLAARGFQVVARATNKVPMLPPVTTSALTLAPMKSKNQIHQYIHNSPLKIVDVLIKAFDTDLAAVVRVLRDEETAFLAVGSGDTWMYMVFPLEYFMRLLADGSETHIFSRLNTISDIVRVGAVDQINPLALYAIEMGDYAKISGLMAWDWRQKPVD